ncbi:MAG TPA: DUF1638 domain-containing protein [Bacillota bacterium]|nr:DUF1638 domain-containing protein [Bacillota bacterium]
MDMGMGFPGTRPDMVVTCQPLAEIVQGLIHADCALHRVDGALHRSPSRLREHLQQLIDVYPGRRIGLAMGLCGGATSGLRAAPGGLALPKVHDCIALLLGSQAAYRELAAECAGTYYLSKGWVDSQGSLLADHARCVDRWGAEQAGRIFGAILHNYRRLVYIHAGLPGEGLAADRGRAFATEFNLDFAILQADLGLLSDLLRGEPAAGAITLKAGAYTSLHDFWEPLHANCPSRRTAPPGDGRGHAPHGNC